jgi:hypothetical protein
MRAPVEEKVTSEQIAELRETLRREALPIWGVTDGATETWTTTPEVAARAARALRALPRLLDEREALLEALTGLENWVTRNVSAEYVVGQPGVRIEALGVARRVLDKVCSP